MSPDSEAMMASDNEDCAAVLNRLYEFLDGECAEDVADEIRAHLDACDNCVEDADVALALKALVKRCCGRACAPPSLRTRIMTQHLTVTYTRVEYTEMHLDL